MPEWPREPETILVGVRSVGGYRLDQNFRNVTIQRSYRISEL